MSLLIQHTVVRPGTAKLQTAKVDSAGCIYVCVHMYNNDIQIKEITSLKVREHKTGWKERKWIGTKGRNRKRKIMQLYFNQNIKN